MFIVTPIPAVVKDPAGARWLAHVKQQGLTGTEVFRLHWAPLLPGEYILNTQGTLRIEGTETVVLEMHHIPKLTPACRLVLSEPLFISGVREINICLMPDPGQYRIDFTIPGQVERYRATFENCVVDACSFCLPQHNRHAAVA